MVAARAEETGEVLVQQRPRLGRQLLPRPVLDPRGRPPQARPSLHRPHVGRPGRHGPLWHPLHLVLAGLRPFSFYGLLHVLDFWKDYLWGKSKTDGKRWRYGPTGETV